VGQGFRCRLVVPVYDVRAARLPVTMRARSRTQSAGQYARNVVDAVIPAQAGIHLGYLPRRQVDILQAGAHLTPGMTRRYHVYILASEVNGTLYIGVTNNLARRVWEHKQGSVEGFTKRYAVHRLVYCESFAQAHDAIQREKQLKKWNRAWKIRLIESVNSGWKDLSLTLVDIP